MNWNRIAKQFLLLAALALLVFALLYQLPSISPSQPDASDSIVLRLAESYPANHPSARAMSLFAETVFEKSDGRIHIKVYGDGELGNEAEVLEQMQFGGVALARVNLLELSDTVPALQAWLTPHGWDTSEIFLKDFLAEETSISSKIQREKLIPLAWFTPDLRCFYSQQLPLRSTEDFSGLNLKSALSQQLDDTLRKLGANPVRILTGDTMKSLSAGFIDGGEAGLCEFMGSDYERLVPYVSVSRYLMSPDVILASGVAFSTISRDDLALLEQCALETVPIQKEWLSEQQQAYLTQLGNEKRLSATPESLDQLLANKLEAAAIHSETEGKDPSESTAPDTMEADAINPGGSNAEVLP